MYGKTNNYHSNDYFLKSQQNRFRNFNTGPVLQSLRLTWEFIHSNEIFIEKILNLFRCKIQTHVMQFDKII